MSVNTGQAECLLDGRLIAELRSRALKAAADGLASGSQMISVPLTVDSDTDLAAVLHVAREPGEFWFCFEQPERGGGSTVAGLGCAQRLVADGKGRLGELAQSWQKLVASTVVSGNEEVRSPIAVGGFAFLPTALGTQQWSEFPSAALTVPEVCAVYKDGSAWLVFSAGLDGQKTADGISNQIVKCANRLVGSSQFPLLDPDPAVRPKVASAMPPEHYESAVASGIERIASGEIEKIVLAREVQVSAGVQFNPGAIYSALRGAFPNCFAFAVGMGTETLVGASPELLIRREGQRVSTVALAGSARRSADPAVDFHFGERLLASKKDRQEHDIVVQRIVQTLGERALWVSAAPEPGVAKVANIQHLATPIRAQLANPVSILQLADDLHPTPAVGGEPAATALKLIPALEGLDRGWYTGGVGWVDAHGGGEFSVVLRCALLSGSLARCYAGVGVVRDSIPSDELAETETKLEAVLPLLI